jgi:beta-galactosidase
VLASYDHPAWDGYAAVTRHRTGSGSLTHLGTMTSPELLRAVLGLVLRDAGVADWAQDLAGTVTVRRGTNAAGRAITYLLNYSAEPVTFAAPVAGRSVLAGADVVAGAEVTVGAWDLLVLES